MHAALRVLAVGIGLVGCIEEPRFEIDEAALLFPQSVDNHEYDHFGHAVASGDFNGDGLAELAVGIPGEDEHSFTIENVGEVRVYGGYGGSFGLWQILKPYADPLVENQDFGAALGVGDFDGDGYDDLAVGAPWRHGGTVYLMRGSPDGLLVWGEIDQGDIGDDNGFDDRFGATLAAGPITGTIGPGGGIVDELVIGTPGETDTVGSFVMKRGAVFIIHQPGSGTPATKIASGGSNGEFGAALAVGDLDGDGHADVAVGAPGVSNDKGRAYIYAGNTPSSWSAMVTYKTYVEPTLPEAGDRTGAALAIGNLIGLPVTTRELAVGMPGRGGTGSVSIYSVSTLFAVALARVLSDGLPESGDEHGAALAIGHVISDETSYEELVIGIPGEDWQSGKIALWRGGASALAMTKLLERTQQQLPQVPAPYAHEIFDRFGAAIAIGRFDGDHDLAIGTPNERPEVVVEGPGEEGYQAGVVYIYDAIAPAGLSFSFMLDQEPGG